MFNLFSGDRLMLGHAAVPPSSRCVLYIGWPHYYFYIASNPMEAVQRRRRRSSCSSRVIWRLHPSQKLDFVLSLSLSLWSLNHWEGPSGYYNYEPRVPTWFVFSPVQISNWKKESILLIVFSFLTREKYSSFNVEWLRKSTLYWERKIKQRFYSEDMNQPLHLLCAI